MIFLNTWLAKIIKKLTIKVSKSKKCQLVLLLNIAYFTEIILLKIKYKYLIVCRIFISLKKKELIKNENQNNYVHKIRNLLPVYCSLNNIFFSNIVHRVNGSVI